MDNQFLLIVISLLLSALFSGAEIAFITANRLKIAIANKDNRLGSKLVQHFINKPQHFIASLLLGNTLMLVIFSSAMEPFLSNKVFPSFHWQINNPFQLLALQTLISTSIVLLFAEFLPKALFRLRPNSVLEFLSPLLYLIYLLLYPIVFLTYKLSEGMLYLFLGQKIKPQTQEFSWIDLDHFIKEYTKPVEDNEVKQEVKMLQAALDFREIRLRECMIPRTEIVAVEYDTQIAGLINQFVESGHSKILIYKRTIDNIIGYVHSFDIFKKPSSIKEILRPVENFPETMKAEIALKKLMTAKKSIAVVLDEFGGTSGIVTIEDLIEEIFGEIDDEFDKNSLTDNQINEKEFIFSGRVEIDYLNEKYNLDLPQDGDYETLAGLIIHKHESIPLVGDQINIGPFCFQILQANGKRIEKVKLVVKK
ncbi:MAG: magnesium and cobalt exporter, family [Bacteroidales bacterium]|jgi:CBS domain containing-hemolysin-like protein|nr:magnesium and cobalt exporter, family [Bacteroidales bacterium]MDN5328358.1 magnesium and cobalt exporter, family [Bacteroidales bacterium]